MIQRLAFTVMTTAVLMGSSKLALSQLGCSLFGGSKPGKVTQVSAGPDLVVEAGTALCAYSGYTWACSPCKDIQFNLEASIKGEPANHEWLSSDPTVHIETPGALKTVATVGDIVPAEVGCVTPSYTLEVRVIDGAGVLWSDRAEVKVNCCGI
jgi:hypothetical protein